MKGFKIEDQQRGMFVALDIHTEIQVELLEQIFQNKTAKLFLVHENKTVAVVIPDNGSQRQDHFFPRKTVIFPYELVFSAPFLSLAGLVRTAVEGEVMLSIEINENSDRLLLFPTSQKYCPLPENTTVLWGKDPMSIGYQLYLHGIYESRDLRTNVLTYDEYVKKEIERQCM